jgi:hypothetical protein
MTAEQNYKKYCEANTDISQHLPTLRRYATGCDTIVELGVRSIVSTWAFLVAQPKYLISVDVKHPREFLDHDPTGCDLNLVEELAYMQGTTFEFYLADSRFINLPLCDLLFIDTIHTSSHLEAEFKKHADNVIKYIILHDTVTHKQDMDGAIGDFLHTHMEWRIEEEFFNNNGLLILKRAE